MASRRPLCPCACKYGAAHSSPLFPRGRTIRTSKAVGDHLNTRWGLYSRGTACLGTPFRRRLPPQLEDLALATGLGRRDVENVVQQRVDLLGVRLCVRVSRVQWVIRVN